MEGNVVKTHMEGSPDNEKGHRNEKDYTSSKQRETLDGQESNSFVDTVHHACLVGYPYHEQIGRFYIHKKKQRNVLWRQFFSPQTYCTGKEEIEISWKILFWVGMTFAFAAIIVAFAKQEFEGTDEEMVLHLSISEFVLAAISIMISLIKHSLKYHQVIKLQKAIRTSKQTQDDREQSSNRRKLYIALAFIWCCFVLILLTGFLIMHFVNKDSHEELVYTRYSTVLALFLTVVLDGLINDVINDAFSQAKADQYRLLIHQLILELKSGSANIKLDERIKDVEDFLHESDLFSVRDKEYFIKADRANSGDGSTMEIVSFDKKKGVTVEDPKGHAKFEIETAATPIDGVRQSPEGSINHAVDLGGKNTDGDTLFNMGTRAKADLVVTIENINESKEDITTKHTGPPSY